MVFRMYAIDLEPVIESSPPLTNMTTSWISAYGKVVPDTSTHDEWVETEPLRDDATDTEITLRYSELESDGNGQLNSVCLVARELAGAQVRRAVDHANETIQALETHATKYTAALVQIEALESKIAWLNAILDKHDSYSR